MHKPFYASGFLYNSASEQILLQQFTDKDEAKLDLFRGKSTNGLEPQAVFHQCVEDLLGEKIAASFIYPVYDYTHHSLGEHFIFFAEISDEAMVKFQKKNRSEWIPMGKFFKYPMSPQTKHDITIGQRVIRSIENPNSATQQT